jgi:DNA-binding NarL/FixJ family response regulator
MSGPWRVAAAPLSNEVAFLVEPTIRVLVAEPHADGDDGACGAIRRDTGFDVLACISNAADAVAQAVELTPDVCVIASDLPLGGLTAAAEIGARLPTAAMVLLHAPDEDDLFGALDAGATAYLPRATSTARLLRAIRSVAAGEAYLSGLQVARVLKAVRDPARARRHVPGRPAFTAREWQVLELLRHRLTTAEIADRLVISPITVRSHTQSIRHKLGAASHEEALDLISAE